ncbi:flagellin [Clostridium beijerinckii]|uniref:flagellin N-terminal helical domain-containing protein n=1 Tax=Clostridium beijerinckii TaxID=1520 RepID=UPI0013619E2B|nr:flagellin [Clostridium beijerinckii]MZK49874.1 hypothetical protein [Clostridium beijerinckii]MZK57833.1 hypothetical protein [Clostridium beijerinckii]MZK68044.1 hypothetical protein [Clostridium beijerinckii]MZK73541.1 hypothetical protein [Clostridium beijerinckii]MZK83124.1 hypothetical protein [Clostridium beijerinckii]
MIINHNIDAIIAINRSNIAGKTKASAMEKLSSGLRINQASDDAAGSAISQKMRAQIRGLEQADRNIQDGISLVQTAEAGLGSIQNPNLSRMRDLIVQALNGTLTQADRMNIQNELDNVKASIDDIANNTEFNTIKLLNMPEAEAKTDTLTSPDTTSSFESTPSVIDLSKATSITIFETTNDTINPYEVTYAINDLASGQTWSPPYYSPPNPAEKYEFSVDLANNTFTTKASAYEGAPLNNITGVRVNGLSGYDSTTAWGSNIVSVTGTPYSAYPATAILGSNLTDYPAFGGGSSDTSITINFEAKKEIAPDSSGTSTTSVITSQGLILQVGANSGEEFYVDLTDARTKALGIDNISVDPIDEAEKALDAVDKAIEIVSKERSKFGAYQNALEHIGNNVGNYSYNITSAESRISDVDMAKESMEMSKSSIIEQSAEAMEKQSENMSQSIIDLMSKWKG